jgi:hypothetical protein
MADKASDYLAVITVSGVGSWARDPNRERAIKDVVRLFKRDFKSYFKLPRGKEINIDVVSITGNGSGKVSWDDFGFHTHDKETLIAVETVQRTL